MNALFLSNEARLTKSAPYSRLPTRSFTAHVNILVHKPSSYGDLAVIAIFWNVIPCSLVETF